MGERLRRPGRVGHGAGPRRLLGRQLDQGRCDGLRVGPLELRRRQEGRRLLRGRHRDDRRDRRRPRRRGLLALGVRTGEGEHVLPCEAPRRILHRAEHAAALPAGGERDLPAPGERADRAVRVDPQRVAAHGHVARRGAAAIREDAGVRGGERREQARVLAVQVLQDEVIAAAQGRELLIRGRRVEVAEVEIVRQRPVEDPIGHEAGRVPGEAREAIGEGSGDGAEADGLDRVAAGRGGAADGLEVGQGDGALRVGLRGRPRGHAGGVRGGGAAGGALVVEGHLPEAAALAEHALARPAPVAEDLDLLVDRAEDDPRDERAHGAPARRVGVAHDRDVGAGLAGHEVGGREEAPRRVAVEVHVRGVDRLPLGRDLQVARKDAVRRLAHDREPHGAPLALPHERADLQRGDADDLHRTKLPDARADLTPPPHASPR